MFMELTAAFLTITTLGGVRPTKQLRCCALLHMAKIEKVTTTITVPKYAWEAMPAAELKAMLGSVIYTELEKEFTKK